MIGALRQRGTAANEFINVCATNERGCKHLLPQFGLPQFGLPLVALGLLAAQASLGARDSLARLRRESAEKAQIWP
jgi:hypothetical protein